MFRQLQENPTCPCVLCKPCAAFNLLRSMQVTCAVCLDEKLGSNRQEFISHILIPLESHRLFFWCERLDVINRHLKFTNPIWRTLKSRSPYVKCDEDKVSGNSFH